MNKTKIPYRKTRRLTIRIFSPSDYEAWKQAHTTMLPKRNAWDRENRPLERLTKSKFQDILKNERLERSKDQNYGFAIFLNKTGELIGSVSVMDIVRGITQNAYIGYIVFNQYWGNGYGKEAVAALIDIAFKDLNLHRIEAGIEPTNRRSILLARSLGFRKEGLKKKIIFMREKWCDLTMYGATCEEFGIKWKENKNNKRKKGN